MIFSEKKKCPVFKGVIFIREPIPLFTGNLKKFPICSKVSGL